jgi:hypothetical protein
MRVRIFCNNAGLQRHVAKIVEFPVSPIFVKKTTLIGQFPLNVLMTSYEFNIKYRRTKYGDVAQEVQLNSWLTKHSLVLRQIRKKGRSAIDT